MMHRHYIHHGNVHFIDYVSNASKLKTTPAPPHCVRETGRGDLGARYILVDHFPPGSVTLLFNHILGEFIK